ncbi:uncharacterized protein LOC111624612 [Centruroides sculpturatus]|uniref:uncharacterized protein LOC111624612 n=1 Tax=Centruroides sculpturatus TaxID=218467 RepID=UPI000C6EF104|nr:uncharacterized protein LOC111624612 [Centruroides sculpturatus]
METETGSPAPTRDLGGGSLSALSAFSGMIPTFSGDVGRVTDFFDTLGEVAGLAGWTPKQCLSIAKCKLTGIARDFAWRDLQMKEVTEYATFKRLMITRFDQEPYSIKVQKFHACTQRKDERVQEFAVRLQTLVSAIIVDQTGTNEQENAVIKRCQQRELDEKLRIQFLHGLNEKMKRNVMTHDPATFSEALKIAIREETIEQLTSKQRNYIGNVEESAENSRTKADKTKPCKEEALEAKINQIAKQIETLGKRLDNRSSTAQTTSARGGEFNQNRRMTTSAMRERQEVGNPNTYSSSPRRFGQPQRSQQPRFPTNNRPSLNYSVQTPSRRYSGYNSLPFRSNYEWGPTNYRQFNPNWLESGIYASPPLPDWYRGNTVPPPNRGEWRVNPNAPEWRVPGINNPFSSRYREQMPFYREQYRQMGPKDDQDFEYLPFNPMSYAQGWFRNDTNAEQSLDNATVPKYLALPSPEESLRQANNVSQELNKDNVGFNRNGNRITSVKTKEQCRDLEQIIDYPREATRLSGVGESKLIDRDSPPCTLVCEIENKRAKLTIDTGAAVSLISKDFFSNLRELKKAETREVELLSVTGHTIDTIGKFDLAFRIGQLNFRHDCYIVDPKITEPNNGILGRDIIEKYDLTISIKNAKLIFPTGNEVTIWGLANLHNNVNNPRNLSEDASQFAMIERQKNGKDGLYQRDLRDLTRTNGNRENSKTGNKKKQKGNSARTKQSKKRIKIGTFFKTENEKQNKTSQSNVNPTQGFSWTLTKAHANADALSRVPIAPINEMRPIYSKAQIREQQLEDSFCKEIRRRLAENTSPQEQRLNTDSSEFYLDVDQTLYHRKTNPERNETWDRLVIPKTMVEYVLKLFHDIPSSGHLGAKKLRKKLQTQFHWPDMNKDIIHYCQTCQECSLRRRPLHGHQAPLQTFPKITKIFERTALDIQGPFPTTNNGNKYLLVFVDHFSRWAEAVPLPDVTAKTVAKAFVTQVILRHSVPKQLLTDRGANFTSKMMREVCDLLHIERLLTTAYHPQCNGMVERLNKTLIDILTHYVDKDQRNWDEMVPYALFAYNTTVHSSTNETPYYLLYGRDPIYPFDVVTEPNRPSYDISENYASELRARLALAHKLAQEHAEKAAIDRKVYQQRRNKPYKFSIGDRVFVTEVTVPLGLKRKLAPRWQGPYRIIAETSPVDFIIQHVHNGKKMHTHANRMKPALARMEFGSFATDEPKSEAETSEASTSEQPLPTSTDPWDDFILESIQPGQVDATETPEMSPQTSVAQPSHNYGLRSRGPVHEYPWVLPTSSKITLPIDAMVTGAEESEALSQGQGHERLPPPTPIGLFKDCKW